jgi:cysteine desulfurase/selenocysteine lyase
MSTSDPGELISALPDDADPTGALNAAAAGMPDPALLARMASEFFGALSTSANTGSIPSTVPQAAARPEISSLTLPSAGRMPTEAELRALPASLGDAAMTAPAAASPAIPSPGFPGGVSAADFSAVPSFSFLQDARGLLAATPVASTPNLSKGTTQAVAVPAAGLIPAADLTPFEREFSSFQSPTSGSIPTSASSLADPGAPLLPGVAAPSADLDRLMSFSFLEDANPLERVGTVPSLVPSTPEAGQLGIDDLSSIPFDVNAVRRDFPILQERINGRQLVWLDNAATTHKPQSVIDRLSYFYAHENSNIHRAAHTLAARATDAYEAAREKVRRFLNASSAREIIFVRGATEAINLVAQSWGRRNIQKDDEIVITWLEHHANIVPWQMLCAEKGAKLRVAPVDNSGQVILDEYEKLLGPRTRLVAFAHVSNALGTVLPVQEMVATAHRYGAKVLVDGAQAVSHMRVDVQAYDCDFYVFSGHKVFAPTGIGVVYGKPDVLEATPPWQGGGNMIADVTFEKTVYQPPPGRFEAGTGSIADAVGLGAAIDYVERIGMANIGRYEHDLLVYATEALLRIPGLHLIGTAREKASVLSFVLDGYRTEEVGSALNQQGIAVRSGHHCAQPILRRFGHETTVRPSLAFYNTCQDVDALVAALWDLKSGRLPGPV